MDQSPKQLRRRAQAFRKLAPMILDGAALKALDDLAAELEARADEAERQGQIEN
jgi:hypothetical protein